MNREEFKEFEKFCEEQDEKDRKEKEAIEKQKEQREKDIVEKIGMLIDVSSALKGEKIILGVDMANGEDKSVENTVELTVSKKTQDHLKKLCKEKYSYDEVINEALDLLEEEEEESKLLKKIMLKNYG